MTTPILGLAELAASQAIPEVTVNENSLRLEQGAQQFAVLDKDLATPPGSPADGDAYIVAASPTGAWTGKAKNIAYYQDGTGWLFIAPREGMRADVADEDIGYRYDGSAWVVTTSGATTVDNDTTLAGDSTTIPPSVHAVRGYVATAVTGLLDFKGSTDCSANPNYPAASKGDAYVVSVAGKIGGASGTSVDVGDIYIASADNAGGTQAAVGTSWFSLEHNAVFGSGSVEVQDEGATETAAATILNFTGAGVTVTDMGGGEAEIDIPGGGSGGAWLLQGGPLDNEAPAANYMTLDSRNSHPVLDADTTTSELGVWTRTLPNDYTAAGVTIDVWVAATSATSGTIGLLIAFERNDASGLDIDADSFGSDTTVTAVTVPGTSGQLLKLSVNIADGSAMDSTAAGELFRLRIKRDVANDTAAGDAEVLRWTMRSQ